MSQKSFIQRQIAELDQLLTRASGSPIMGANLRSRREELAKDLEDAPAEFASARAVLYFTGRPVFGSFGIDAQFTTKAIDPFVAMARTEFAAEEIVMTGRRARFEDSRLMITGLPRGSFGIELTQPDPETFFSSQICTSSLSRVISLIEAAAKSDEAFDAEVGKVTPKVLPHLKVFLKAIADERAGVRLVAGDLEVVVENEKAYEAFERVSQVEEAAEEITVDGFFRGGTIDSGRFDFLTKTNEQISGTFGEDVTEEQITKMDHQTNQPCVGIFRIVTITPPGGKPRKRYVLLGLK